MESETFSAEMDVLLGRIYADATSETDTPVALIAIGGYGRCQLCLHSDIDLLILFGGPIEASEERIVKALLHPLWDLGLAVGHQIRQLSELEQPEVDNPEFLTAVTNARFLAGEASLFDGFTQEVLSPRSAWRQPTVDALCQLVADRHHTFNSTIYQLEPDIKEAPGALRDINAIRTLAELTQPETGRAVPLTAGRLE